MKKVPLVEVVGQSERPATDRQSVSSATNNSRFAALPGPWEPKETLDRPLPSQLEPLTQLYLNKRSEWRWPGTYSKGNKVDISKLITIARPTWRPPSRCSSSFLVRQRAAGRPVEILITFLDILADFLAFLTSGETACLD